MVFLFFVFRLTKSPSLFMIKNYMNILILSTLFLKGSSSVPARWMFWGPLPCHHPADCGKDSRDRQDGAFDPPVRIEPLPCPWFYGQDLWHWERRDHLLGDTWGTEKGQSRIKNRGRSCVNLNSNLACNTSLLSLPRKRESRKFLKDWIPASAGMTS